jgi:FkbM family methyltransferase
MDRATAAATARDGVKRLLARTGLEVRRRGAGPRRTLAEVLDHTRAQGFAPAAIVDVGVATGTPELYAAFPEARLLLVEPLREYLPALDGLRATRGAEVELAAAGRAAGTTELTVHRVLACSSIVGERTGDEADVTRREVPVVRVDELCAARGIDGPYVLKVDVEGFELDVVAGAQGILPRTELVLLEVSLFQLNGANPQLGDVVCAMRDLGYVVYDVYNGHLRPLDGALAQLDLAFVRDDGPFRRTHAYATPAQADRMYASWGF